MNMIFSLIRYIAFASYIVCISQSFIHARAGTYMHDTELMQLVHGELKGTLLWAWDASIVQHPLTTMACMAAIVSVIAYEYSTSMNKKFQSLLAAIRAEVQRIELEQAGRVIQSLSDKLTLLKKSESA